MCTERMGVLRGFMDVQIQLLTKPFTSVCVGGNFRVLLARHVVNELLSVKWVIANMRGRTISCFSHLNNLSYQLFRTISQTDCLKHVYSGWQLSFFLNHQHAKTATERHNEQNAQCESGLYFLLFLQFHTTAKTMSTALIFYLVFCCHNSHPIIIPFYFSFIPIFLLNSSATVLIFLITIIFVYYQLIIFIIIIVYCHNIITITIINNTKSSFSSSWTLFLFYNSNNINIVIRHTNFFSLFPFPPKCRR